MRILSSIACLIILAGCGHDTGHTTHSDSEPKADRHDPVVTLALNDGKKWKVDEHTRASAAQMLGLVENAQPIDSVDAARNLAGAIDDELNNLVQGCTMTGPSHDQLHVFLAALFPKLGELKTKTDVEELRAAQEAIVSLFDSYERHFE